MIRSIMFFLLLLSIIIGIAQAKTVMQAVTEYEQRINQTGELTIKEAENLSALYKLPFNSEAPAHLLLQPAKPVPAPTPTAETPVRTVKEVIAQVGGNSLNMNRVSTEQDFNLLYDHNNAKLANQQESNLNCSRRCEGSGTFSNSNVIGEETPCSGPNASLECFQMEPPAPLLDPSTYQLVNGPDRSRKIENAIALIRRIYLEQAVGAMCSHRCSQESSGRKPPSETSRPPDSSSSGPANEGSGATR